MVPCRSGFLFIKSSSKSSFANRLKRPETRMVDTFVRIAAPGMILYGRHNYMKLTWYHVNFSIGSYSPASHDPPAPVLYGTPGAWDAIHPRKESPLPLANFI